MTSFLRTDRSRTAAVWLFCIAALVLAMVVVGGATRLTGSGLSITEWKPVSGVIPPLSHEAWMAEFRNYQQIPQYRFVNQGMTLAQFQGIFWWEWAHRLLGRMVGVVFFLPFVVLLALRRLPPRLIWRCVGLFVLGGLQGLLGWLMVSSGLGGPQNHENLVHVAPEMLAAHQGLALIIFCAAIWTGWEAWAGQARASRPGGWGPATAALATLVYIQCLLGALVAGNKAGQVYNDWPRMNGAWFPRSYVLGGLWRTLTRSQAAVQFNHRIGAYLVLILALSLAVAAARSRYLAGNFRAMALFTGALVLAQACLGVATLMLAAPLAFSLAHQLLAALVLGAAVTLAWRAARLS
ncbi:COX15/CtaA family protein [Phenylobacterium montanum]|uniref:Heme A synthase n=1 Tax=Phenylobacterium montanum TaxID=2823693 RepID=A0A975IVN6_9CAUL|nr:COX15/CtaA family protein [Caulobacter sp. S6]QUD88965.1 COX15/CtaA family protein [Caulobacter sp. S6]